MCALTGCSVGHLQAAGRNTGSNHTKWLRYPRCCSVGLAWLPLTVLWENWIDDSDRGPWKLSIFGSFGGVYSGVSHSKKGRYFLQISVYFPAYSRLSHPLSSDPSALCIRLSNDQVSHRTNTLWVFSSGFLKLTRQEGLGLAPCTLVAVEGADLGERRQTDILLLPEAIGQNPPNLFWLNLKCYICLILDNTS